LRHGAKRAAIGCVDRHYREMSIAELKALPIAALAADRCALALGLVWHKLTKDGRSRIAKGFTTRSSTEPCLFASASDSRSSAIYQSTSISRLARANTPASRTRLVRNSSASSVTCRCELFARDRHPGWDVVGDQLGHFEPPSLQPSLQSSLQFSLPFSEEIVDE
jgi:N6-adenosine-specific RNA methylase IME4